MKIAHVKYFRSLKKINDFKVLIKHLKRTLISNDSLMLQQHFNRYIEHKFKSKKAFMVILVLEHLRRHKKEFQVFDNQKQ